jgi:hypothetical protein
MIIARLSVAAALTPVAAAAIAAITFAAGTGNAAHRGPIASATAATPPGRYSADSSATLPAVGPAQRLPRSRADGALGVTDASWSTAHKLDTTAGRVLAYDALPGLANGATDRFTEVTETNGRVSYLDLRFKPRTSIVRAIRLARSLLPADATYGQLGGCDGYGMAVRSATLRAELGSPDAAIFFLSSGASFNSGAITDAEIAAGETVVTRC